VGRWLEVARRAEAKGGGGFGRVVMVWEAQLFCTSLGTQMAYRVLAMYSTWPRDHDRMNTPLLPTQQALVTNALALTHVTKVSCSC
jgi:hypothetical protein